MLGVLPGFNGYLGPYWEDIIGFFNGLDIAVVAAIALSAIYFWKIKK